MLLVRQSGGNMATKRGSPAKDLVVGLGKWGDPRDRRQKRGITIDQKTGLKIIQDYADRVRAETPKDGQFWVWRMPMCCARHWQSLRWRLWHLEYKSRHPERDDGWYLMQRQLDDGRLLVMWRRRPEGSKQVDPRIKQSRQSSRQSSRPAPH